MSQGLILNNGTEMYRESAFNAGQDIRSAEDITIPKRSSVLISTKLFIAIPTNFVGLIWPRSGLSVKHNIECGAGCIDSNYRGEVKVHLYNHGDTDYEIKTGDRIAQLLTMPVSLQEYAPVDELPSSDREESGFGSSGKN